MNIFDNFQLSRTFLPLTSYIFPGFLKFELTQLIIFFRTFWKQKNVKKSNFSRFKNFADIRDYYYYASK